MPCCIDFCRRNFSFSEKYFYFRNEIVYVSRTTTDLIPSFPLAAVMFAGKAQVCLKECFRVLEPHLHTVPQDRRGDYDALKSMGLLQMLKIYNLLYGGRIIDTGVSSMY